MKRRIAALLLACVTAMSVSACGGEETAQESAGEETQTAETQNEESRDGGAGGTLVAYFHMIGEETGGELFSIRTVEKYPDSYDDTVDQGQEEQREDARPQLETHIENLEDYGTVFLGYPNWWGDMPMAVYSFLEEYDLSGKTVIPFVTSGGSGFSDTVSRIEELQPDADVKEGIAISASGAMDAREEIRSWLDGLGY